MEHPKQGDQEEYLGIKRFRHVESAELEITLKKVMKTCEVELAVKTKARKVLKPPLRTAGPMSLRV